MPPLYLAVISSLDSADRGYCTPVLFFKAVLLLESRREGSLKRFLNSEHKGCAPKLRRTKDHVSRPRPAFWIRVRLLLGCRLDAFLSGRRERRGDNLAEKSGIARWVQFATAVLFFLVVPNDPASGAFYVFNRRTHTWIWMDFGDCRFLRLVERPSLPRITYGWFVQAGMDP
jgi:hypothetical protein